MKVPAVPSSAVRSMLTICALCLVSAAASACGGAEERPHGAVIRDSAGVAIVESHSPQWSDGDGWSLSREPLVRIGSVEGAPEYQFSRIEGAVRLSDGRIVVADAGANEVRFFDAAGRFLTKTGRRGDAPGEYRQIVSLGLGPGDSIWVYDFGNRRFTIIDRDGRVGHTLALGGVLSSVGAVGRTSDGSYVVREFWSSHVHGGEVRLGLARDPAAVARYSADAARIDTIGLFPGREVYVGSEDGRAVMSAPLFARTTSVALRGDEVVVGDEERFEVGVYSVGGVLQRLIRRPGVDLRVGEDDVEREIEQRLASEPQERRASLRAHIEAMDHPETRPAYGQILAGAAGNLWVAAYAPYPAVPTAWWVFDREGRLLGTVQVPERLRVYQIGDDWLLGVWRDDLDVEYVQVFGISKAGGSG
jgi:hypothetical protein